MKTKDIIIIASLILVGFISALTMFSITKQDTHEAKEVTITTTYQLSEAEKKLAEVELLLKQQSEMIEKLNTTILDSACHKKYVDINKKTGRAKR